MSESELTWGTQRRLELLFQAEDRTEAARLLIEECGNNLPLCKNLTPQNLERIRYAALKLGGGNLSEFRKAVQLAKVDWRDLLVAADFGDDPQAHERWMP